MTSCQTTVKEKLKAFSAATHGWPVFTPVEKTQTASFGKDPAHLISLRKRMRIRPGSEGLRMLVHFSYTLLLLRHWMN
jgi:hypothetical protein